MKYMKYNLEILFNYSGLYICRMLLKRDSVVFNYDFRSGCERVDYPQSGEKSYKWVRAITGYGDGWIR
jgi:hypothetical protein